MLAAARRRAPQIPLLRRAASTASSPAAATARTWVYGTTFVVGAGAFAAYYADSRSAAHRYLFTPLVRAILDPEASHKLAVQTLATGLAPRDLGSNDRVLACPIWDKHLSSPVGLAAGFDKDGEAVDGLLNLGFAWVEIGSVTPEPQAGNPKPRVFHLHDEQAIINRYGFPSKGHGAMAARLHARRASQPAPDGQLLAVNLGKMKTSAADAPDDYVTGVRKFAPYADVLVVNVSSPNTPGLRDLQRKDVLETLLTAVVKARDESERKPKLVLKVAPDLTRNELADIATAVVRCRVDGVIVSNTTIQRPLSVKSANVTETGGLSGPPLLPLSLAAIRTLRAHLPPSIPLIGCGGISSGADALEFARSGASCVQLYTAFAYDGPGAPRRIKDELTALLKEQNTTWEAVVKQSVDKLAKGAEERIHVREMIREAEALRERADRLGRTMALVGQVAAFE